MQGYFLSDNEREQHQRFPAEIPSRDVSDYFTLSVADRRRVNRQRGDHNRLGFALQLCALRYLGFAPDELTSAPASVVMFVADQLQVSPTCLSTYGQRAHTRTDHLQEILDSMGYRKATPADWCHLTSWLKERALEHDNPTLLLQLACEKLQREKIVRPGITRLERLVLQVRQDGQAEIYQRIAPLLIADRRQLLDQLLIVDPELRRTPLTWLRQAAIANSPPAIMNALKKLTYLRQMPLENVSMLNPNRLKLLAQIGRRSNPPALQRLPEERRYPILLAFWHQTLVETTDEALDLFDRCLAETEARASRDLVEFRTTVARATNEKVRLFGEVGRVVLDTTIRDTTLRRAIYQRISREHLQRAVAEAEKIARPDDDNYFDFLETRYSYLRQFVPSFLAGFVFHSNIPADPLLKAVTVLQDLNATRHRVVPDDAPLECLPRKWLPYVVARDGRIDRHYYELSVLWELRNALRAGNI